MSAAGSFHASPSHAEMSAYWGGKVILILRISGFDPERTLGATYLVANRRTLCSPIPVTVIIPAIEPTPNPATPNQVALVQ